MRLGVNIPNFGPESSPTTLLDWVRFGEEAGFAIAMLSDHVAPTPEVEAIYPPPFWDPFTSLAWLAGQSRTIRLGASVIVLPYRHPVQVARLAATVDQLSGGRLVLGVGVGWSATEYAALGVPFEDRGRLTDEYLEVLTAFRSGAHVSHDGPAMPFREVGTLPRAVQPGGVPIWVGGGTGVALRRSARFGDAWHPNPPDPKRVEGQLATLMAEAARIGQPVPAFAPRIKLRITETTVPEEGRPYGVGTLDQILVDLERLTLLGATDVILDTNPDTLQLRDYEAEMGQLARAIEVARERGLVGSIPATELVGPIT